MLPPTVKKLLSSHKLREKGEKIKPLGGMIKTGFKAESISETAHWTCDCPGWGWGWGALSLLTPFCQVHAHGSCSMKEGNLIPTMTLGGSPHFSVLANGMSSVWV